MDNIRKGWLTFSIPGIQIGWIPANPWDNKLWKDNQFKGKEKTRVLDCKNWNNASYVLHVPSAKCNTEGPIVCGINIDESSSYHLPNRTREIKTHLRFYSLWMSCDIRFFFGNVMNSKESLIKLPSLRLASFRFWLKSVLQEEQLFPQVQLQ